MTFVQVVNRGTGFAASNESYLTKNPFFGSGLISQKAERKYNPVLEILLWVDIHLNSHGLMIEKKEVFSRYK